MLYKLPVYMQGENMNLVLSRYARKRILDQSLIDEPEGILFRVFLLMQQADVADQLLNEVRIDGGAVIIDLDRNCSYNLVAEEDGFIIRTVSYHCVERRRMFIKPEDFCLVIRNASLQFAAQFDSMRMQPFLPVMVSGGCR